MPINTAADFDKLSETGAYSTFFPVVDASDLVRRLAGRLIQQGCLLLRADLRYPCLS
jgi:hypothetical protein